MKIFTHFSIFFTNVNKEGLNNQFKLLTNKKMKTLDRKKYTEDKGSSVSETTVGRSAKVALLGMLALWYWALSTQAQTKIQETKKDLIETVSDSSVAWKSYRDIWFFEAQDPIVKDEKEIIAWEN